jgi:hypothetical protein
MSEMTTREHDAMLDQHTEAVEKEKVMSAISPEIREKLRASFPPEAYSKHPTKTFLTNLKAMYVVERLNDVFGLGRWNMVSDIVQQPDPKYVLMKGCLVLHDYDATVPIQYGGHPVLKPHDLADSYKSAITDLISKSASYLEIGLDMFKGLIKPPAKSVSQGVRNVQNNNF